MQGRIKKSVTERLLAMLLLLLLLLLSLLLQRQQIQDHSPLTQIRPEDLKPALQSTRHDPLTHLTSTEFGTAGHNTFVLHGASTAGPAVSGESFSGTEAADLQNINSNTINRCIV
jgi:hypothetical protein